jgi:hypothetical protein
MQLRGKMVLCSPQLGSVEERLLWKREMPLRSSLGSPASWYGGARPGKVVAAQP